MKKGGLGVTEYVRKNKMLTDELQSVGYPIFEEEALMYMLGGLDENFDNVFSTMIEKMLSEKVTIDDIKALLLSRKIVFTFPYLLLI